MVLIQSKGKIRNTETGQVKSSGGGSTYTAPQGAAIDSVQSAFGGTGALTPAQSAAIANAKKEFTPTSYLSSEDGMGLVKNAESKINNLSTNPVTTDAQGKETIGTGAAGTGTGAQGTQTGLALEDVLTVTKDLTGWTLNADGTYTPTADALKSLGVTKDNTQGDDADKALSKAKAERDAAFLKLQNFDVSGDPALQGIVKGISGSWDTRIAEMDRVNRSRSAAMRTTGIRMGSRYTGGDGGTMGSIISEEERQGIERISGLEAQKQAAIADAKQAFEDKKWNRYYQLAGLADKKYQEQLEEVKELNKAQAKQDEELRKQNATIEKNDSIYNAIVSAGGKTDPMHIYQAVRAQGIDVSMDDVDKFWDAVKPSTDGLYKFSNSQVGKMFARGYSADMIQAIQGDLNDGGEDTVIAGLPASEQAWVKNILDSQPVGGVGGTLTRAETRDLFKGTAYPELALSLAGMDESQILGDLQGTSPPKWFVNGIQNQDAMEYDWQFMLQKWDAFRSATISGYFAKAGGGDDDIFGSASTPLATPQDEQ